MSDINNSTGGYAYIYKIYPKGNPRSDECYIGSTTKSLRERLNSHIYDFKKYLNGKHHRVSSFVLFDKYGVDGIEIGEYEIYKFDDKADLRRREGDYIKSFECVNDKIAGRTQQECMKEWHITNREERLVKMKQYYDNNREERLVKTKQYYDNNREERLAKMKQYYDNNREEKLAKITCECGCVVSKACLVRHQKRAIHLSLMNKK